MCICLCPEFDSPEVTLRGWQNIKIQLLLLLLICYRASAQSKETIEVAVSHTLLVVGVFAGGEGAGGSGGGSCLCVAKWRNLKSRSKSRKQIAEDIVCEDAVFVCMLFNWNRDGPAVGRLWTDLNTKQNRPFIQKHWGCHWVIEIERQLKGLQEDLNTTPEQTVYKETVCFESVFMKKHCFESTHKGFY